MAPDRVFPDAGTSGAPPPGAYYNLKNQQMPPPATYQRPGRRGRSPCCCCFAWLCSIITILVVLIGLAVLIFWLVVRPKAPQFHVESVHITGLTGSSPFNSSINYTIEARNPNKKMSFYYSDINVKVESDGTIVGQGTVASFSQGDRNTTELSGTISQENVSLSSEDQTAIESDPSDVPIYAEVNLRVRVKVGSIKSKKMKVKVKCNVIADLTITNGQSQLKSSKCKVDW